MKSHADTHRRKIRLPHLTYSAFCLTARVGTAGFLKLNLTAIANDANSLCPVKQKRALLKSNPPRDNWIEGDEIKTVSAFGEAQTSPNVRLETFISEPSHALKNFPGPSKTDFPAGQNKQATLKTNHSNSYPFFRSKRTSRAARRSQTQRLPGRSRGRRPEAGLKLVWKNSGLDMIKLG